MEDNGNKRLTDLPVPQAAVFKDGHELWKWKWVLYVCVRELRYVVGGVTFLHLNKGSYIYLVLCSMIPRSTLILP